MADTTNIAYVEYTFNPWLGCSPVSPVCNNCYAMRYFKRFKLKSGERRRTSAANWKKPLAWNRKAAKVEPTDITCLCGVDIEATAQANGLLVSIDSIGDAILHEPEKTDNSEER